MKLVDQQDKSDQEGQEADGGVEGRFNYPEGQYRDKTFFVLFYVHLALMLALGGMYGPAALQSQSKAAQSGSEQPVTNIGTDYDVKLLVIVLLFGAFIGAVFGGLWLKIMRTCRIMTLLKIYLVMVAMFAGALLVMGQLMAAAISGLMLVFLTYWLFCCARASIPFAEAMMKASSQALKDNSNAVSVQYGLSVVQIIWVTVWFAIAISIFVHLIEVGTSSMMKNVAYFFLLISLYWSSEVVKNVGHVTTAGVVASWWYMPNATSPTYSAFKRSVTTSFGSICMGSLIVAILKAIRTMLRQAMNQAKNNQNTFTFCLLCIIECILGCIENLVEYFNMYAYTHVAVYGEDYITAAKSTFRLFTASGLTLITNDNITGMVLSLGVFLGGLMAGLGCGLFTLVLLPSSGQTFLMAVLGFFAGAVMTSVITVAMQSAIATTFVCWAEDPALMEEGRPVYYKGIVDATHGQFPDF